MHVTNTFRESGDGGAAAIVTTLPTVACIKDNNVVLGINLF